MPHIARNKLTLQNPQQARLSTGETPRDALESFLKDRDSAYPVPEAQAAIESDKHYTTITVK